MACFFLFWGLYAVYGVWWVRCVAGVRAVVLVADDREGEHKKRKEEGGGCPGQVAKPSFDRSERAKTALRLAVVSVDGDNVRPVRLDVEGVVVALHNVLVPVAVLLYLTKPYAIILPELRQPKPQGRLEVRLESVEDRPKNVRDRLGGRGRC